MQYHNILGKPEDKNGFSLIEVMVVLLIVGIISSVALPKFNRYITKARMQDVFTNARQLQIYVSEKIMESDLEYDFNPIVNILNNKYATYSYTSSNKTITINLNNSTLNLNPGNNIITCKINNNHQWVYSINNSNLKDYIPSVYLQQENE